jgi:adenine/guanine/hypoxanthine permease
MATMSPRNPGAWPAAQAPTASPMPAPAAPAVATAAPPAAHEGRGGLATLLGSIYIVVLIPMILGGGAGSTSMPTASVASTALACAVGTTLFALATRLPFAIGPGIVPASIVASFLAGGIPLGVVLGIEVLAGLLFMLLAASGAIQAWVRHTPQVLKTAGQVAIGLYLLLAALRATGLVSSGADAASASPGPQGLLFLGGLAVVLLLHRHRRLGGYALLAGIGLATAGAALLGLVARPTAWFALPQLALAVPDIGGALSLHYLDETLVLLYVVVVDVVATLETIGSCAPALRGADGRLRHFDRALQMSAVVFLASPWLGTAPMLVLFESLGGVVSGARGRGAALLCAAGFGAMVLLSPLAGAVPGFACAVALAYIGHTIAGTSAAALPADPRQPALRQLGWQLAALALLTVVATNSLALTIFMLFAAYPVIAWRLGQRPRPAELAAAAASAALITMVLR